MGKEKKLPTEEELFEIICNIKKLPFAQRVKILHHLERYRWIDELPGKPDKFDEMSCEEKSLWVTPISSYFHSLIGEKALLRYYHTTELGRTDQEFDDWWDSKQYKLLKMFEKKNYHVKDDATQRTNNSTDKSYNQIVPMLVGFILGSLVGKILLLILKIVGIL